MRVPAFVCVLALVASVFCTGESVEFGASIPVGFFEGFYNRLVFPLLDDYSKGFGRNFPSDCCYKGRGLVSLSVILPFFRSLHPKMCFLPFRSEDSSDQPY